jgi:hypothetical protein
VLSKVQFRRPQNLPATHGTGTVVVTVAPGGISRPPGEPLKTGVGLPAPATQTVSEQLFLMVNWRVWAAAEAHRYRIVSTTTLIAKIVRGVFRPVSIKLLPLKRAVILKARSLRLKDPDNAQTFHVRLRGNSATIDFFVRHNNFPQAL